MASFEVADSFVAKNEGGFQKNPNDPGNWYNGELQGTKWGISAPVARDNGYLGLMEDMPESFAVSIRRKNYWEGLGSLVTQAIATKIYDMRINFGKNGGSELAQAAANNLGAGLVTDGVLGPLSISAFNRLEPTRLMAELVIQAESAYRADVARNPSKAGFLDGWIARARKIPPGLVAAGASGMLVLLAIGLYVAWKS